MTTTSMLEAETPLYELSVNVRVSWQAHSLSNAGSNGSNRLYPRRQLLATGEETDACSGNIAKHYHSHLFAEYAKNAPTGEDTPARQRLSKGARAPP